MALRVLGNVYFFGTRKRGSGFGENWIKTQKLRKHQAPSLVRSSGGPLRARSPLHRPGCSGPLGLFCSMEEGQRLGGPGVVAYQGPQNRDP